MKTHSEVNFEKRGRIEDHQPCPVTGECQCVCDHCKPSKKLFAAVLFALLLFLPSLSIAGGPPSVIPYTVETITELNVASRNIKGEYISNRFDLQANAITATAVTRRGTFDISCGGDTSAQDINRKTKIVGGCTTTNVGERTQYGFLRHTSGELELYNVPGADGTDFHAVADNDMIGGSYFNPLEFNRSGLYRFKAFLKHRKSIFSTDFPLADTFTNMWGVNRRGKALVEAVTFNPATNETVKALWAIYDNGQFTILPFPNNPQGPDTFLIGPNEDDQFAVIRTGGDEDWNGIFLYDDGKLFEIGLPATIDGKPTIWSVAGLVENGEIFGSYSVEVGTDPYYGWPIRKHFGFVATPKKN